MNRSSESSSSLPWFLVYLATLVGQVSVGTTRVATKSDQGVLSWHNT